MTRVCSERELSKLFNCYNLVNFHTAKSIIENATGIRTHDLTDHSGLRAILEHWKTMLHVIKARLQSDQKGTFNLKINPLCINYSIALSLSFMWSIILLHLSRNANSLPNYVFRNGSASSVDCAIIAARHIVQKVVWQLNGS